MAGTATFVEGDVSFLWSDSAQTSTLSGTATRSLEWFNYKHMSEQSIAARQTDLVGMSRQETQSAEFINIPIESKIGPWSASLNDRVAASQVLRFEDDWAGNGVTGLLQQRKQNRRRFGVTMRAYSLNVPEYLAPFSQHDDLADALSHVVKKIEVVDRLSLLEHLNCLQLPTNTTFTGDNAQGDARTANLLAVVHPNTQKTTSSTLFAGVDDGGYAPAATYTPGTTAPRPLSVYHIQVAVDTMLANGTRGMNDEMILLLDAPSWGRLRTTTDAGNRDFINTMIPIGSTTSTTPNRQLSVAPNIHVVPLDYSPGGVTTGYVRQTVSSVDYDIRSAWLIRKSGFVSSSFAQFPKNQIRVFLQKEYARTLITHVNFSGWRLMGQDVIRIDYASQTL